MTHWRQEAKKDSKMLYHYDIAEKSPVKVTIESTFMDEVKTSEGEKSLFFLKFKGAKKALGCNITNGELIEQTFGSPHKEEWIGKEIILRTAKCRGDECIRVATPQGFKKPKACPTWQYTDNVKKEEVAK